MPVFQHVQQELKSGTSEIWEISYMFDGKYTQKHLNAIPSIMEAIYFNCKTFRLFQDNPS